MALSDSQVSALLAERRWTAVVVVTREDVLALRLTLLVKHLLAGCAAVGDVVRQDDRARAPPRDAGGAGGLAVGTGGGGSGGEGGRGGRPRARRRRTGTALVDDALRLLARAGAGIVAALIVEGTIGAIALHESFVNALYFSTRSVATVAGTPGAERAAAWYKVVSVLDTLAALALVAVFTAALVRRLSRPRLTTLVGGARGTGPPPRAARSASVRWASASRRSCAAAAWRCWAWSATRTRRACAWRGRRGSRSRSGAATTARPSNASGIRRCAAVAAVTSDDLVNVAVGLAATDLAPGVPLVLRLGDGEVAAETDSLLHLGQICDAHKIAADTLMQGLSGAAPAPAAAPGTVLD